jgi:gliding motility-associated-like protein
MNRFVINIVIPLILFFIWHPLSSIAQCGNGQTPMTATPICNTNTISQGSVAACNPQYIPFVDQYGCINYSPLNYYTGKPMWYKFHCYASGTFGFLLKYNITDTYEWQLFDITGHNPNDVFTNDTLTILGNWSVNTLGYKGIAAGNLLIFGCALGPFYQIPALNYMKTIQQGHDYLLLINHGSSTPDYGYQIVFQGGNANITSDNTKPTLTTASTKCGLSQIGIRLSKTIQCNSIAADGSDFEINVSSVSITNAVPYNCIPGLGTDSITLTLSNSLPAGTYDILVKTGTDNNTLLDFCNNTSDIGNSLSFAFGDSKAAFKGPAFCCPNDLVIFTDSSKGNIISWNWDFSNGVTSILQNPPPQSYPVTATSVDLPVRLIVKDVNNCMDTAYNNIKVINNCYIAVPSAFTPNHDGNNDYLYPLNAWKAKDLVFRVYNRSGQLVFFTKEWTRKWNGTFKGLDQPTGVYVWELTYIDENNKKIALKGTSLLIR